MLNKPAANVVIHKNYLSLFNRILMIFSPIVQYHVPINGAQCFLRFKIFRGKLYPYDFYSAEPTKEALEEIKNMDKNFEMQVMHVSGQTGEA